MSLIYGVAVIVALITGEGVVSVGVGEACLLFVNASVGMLLAVTLPGVASGLTDIAQRNPRPKLL